MGSRANRNNRNESVFDGVDTSKLEDAIRNHLERMFQESRSRIQPYFDNWHRHARMFQADFVAPNASGPYGELHIAIGARSIIRNMARQRQASIPDPQTMRFFAAIPQSSSSSELPKPEYDKLRGYVESSIQHDLMRCHYGEVNAMTVMNRELRGNGYELVHLGPTVKPVPKNIRNSLYIAAESGQMLPPNYAWFKNDDDRIIVVEQTADGHQETVDEWAEVFQCVEEQAPPKITSLNPFNVLPTEFDRDGLDKCTGAFIYDIVSKWDLLKDEVRDDEWDGAIGNYANMDAVGDWKSPYIPGSVMDNDDDGMNQSIDTAGLNKLGRISYWGAIDWNSILDQEGLTRESPEYIALLEKFNANVNRARYLKTWVAEFVGIPDATMLTTMVRLQPSPYNFQKDGEADDCIPITQYRKWAMPNETLGYSDYHRNELPERIANKAIHDKLEQLDYLVNPPVMFYPQGIKGSWLNAQGGDSFQGLKPRQMIPGTQPGGPPPIVPISLPTAGIEHARDVEGSMVSWIEQQGTPAVASGQTGGSNSAREVTVAATGVDQIDQMTAQDFGFGQTRMLEKMFSLHAQFDRNPRVVTVPGEDGKWSTVNVPPSAYQNGCLFFATGAKTIANRELRMQFFEMLANKLEQFDIINKEELVKRMAIAGDIDNPQALVQDPPPAEGAPKRVAGSSAADIQKYPGAIQVALWDYMSDGEIKFPENAAQMIDNNAATLALMDKFKEWMGANGNTSNGLLPTAPGNQPQPAASTGPPQPAGPIMPPEAMPPPVPDIDNQPAPLIDQGVTPTGLQNIQGSL